jgi:hypothetical protein
MDYKRMDQNDSPVTIDVQCPCCRASLHVDALLGVVLSHTVPKAPPSVDLDDTARILREQRERVEEKFRQSVESERVKNDVLDRKFQDGLRRAKESPVEKPIRDFDLD